MHVSNILSLLLTAASFAQAGVIRHPHHELRSMSSQGPLAKGNQASLSHVPIGAVINQCTVPGTIALTFDDGPYIYTPTVLDTLASYGAVATFFLNGVNEENLGSGIENFPHLARRALAEGHQLASHTWSHPYLFTLDYETIKAQMTKLEESFMRIIGVFPTYMRMPFLMFNDVALAAMADLGYHVIGASIDTKDYENDDPGLSWLSFEKFKAELNAGGNIVLAHDVHQTTTEVLVDNMLEEIQQRGLKTVTVGQCLGDPPEYWYRASR